MFNIHLLIKPPKQLSAQPFTKTFTAYQTNTIQTNARIMNTPFYYLLVGDNTITLVGKKDMKVFKEVEIGEVWDVEVNGRLVVVLCRDCICVLDKYLNVVCRKEWDEECSSDRMRECSNGNCCRNDNSNGNDNRSDNISCCRNDNSNDNECCDNSATTINDTTISDTAINDTTITTINDDKFHKQNNKTAEQTNSCTMPDRSLHVCDQFIYVIKNGECTVYSHNLHKIKTIQNVRSIHNDLIYSTSSHLIHTESKYKIPDITHIRVHDDLIITTSNQTLSVYVRLNGTLYQKASVPKFGTLVHTDKDTIVMVDGNYEYEMAVVRECAVSDGVLLFSDGRDVIGSDYGRASVPLPFYMWRVGGVEAFCGWKGRVAWVKDGWVYVNGERVFAIEGVDEVEEGMDEDEVEEDEEGVSKEGVDGVGKEGVDGVRDDKGVDEVEERINEVRDEKGMNDESKIKEGMNDEEQNNNENNNENNDENNNKNNIKTVKSNKIRKFVQYRMSYADDTLFIITNIVDLNKNATYSKIYTCGERYAFKVHVFKIIARDVLLTVDGDLCRWNMRSKTCVARQAVYNALTRIHRYRLVNNFRMSNGIFMMDGLLYAVGGRRGVKVEDFVVDDELFVISDGMHVYRRRERALYDREDERVGYCKDYDQNDSHSRNENDNNNQYDNNDQTVLDGYEHVLSVKLHTPTKILHVFSYTVLMCTYDSLEAVDLPYLIKKVLDQHSDINEVLRIVRTKNVEYGNFRNVYDVRRTYDNFCRIWDGLRMNVREDVCVKGCFGCGMMVGKDGGADDCAVLSLEMMGDDEKLMNEKLRDEKLSDEKLRDDKTYEDRRIMRDDKTMRDDETLINDKIMKDKIRDDRIMKDTPHKTNISLTNNAPVTPAAFIAHFISLNDPLLSTRIFLKCKLPLHALQVVQTTGRMDLLHLIRKEYTDDEVFRKGLLLFDTVFIERLRVMMNVGVVVDERRLRFFVYDYLGMYEHAFYWIGRDNNSNLVGDNELDLIEDNELDLIRDSKLDLGLVENTNSDLIGDNQLVSIRDDNLGLKEKTNSDLIGGRKDLLRGTNLLENTNSNLLENDYNAIRKDLTEKNYDELRAQYIIKHELYELAATHPQFYKLALPFFKGTRAYEIIRQFNEQESINYAKTHINILWHNILPYINTNDELNMTDYTRAMYYARTGRAATAITMLIKNERMIDALEVYNDHKSTCTVVYDVLIRSCATYLNSMIGQMESMREKVKKLRMKYGRMREMEMDDMSVSTTRSRLKGVEGVRCRLERVEGEMKGMEELKVMVLFVGEWERSKISDNDDGKVDVVDKDDDKIENDDGKVDVIDDKLESQNGKVESQNGKVDVIDDKLESQNGKVDVIDDKLESQNSKVENQNSKVEDQNDKISNTNINVSADEGEGGDKLRCGKKNIKGGYDEMNNNKLKGERNDGICTRWMAVQTALKEEIDMLRKEIKDTL